MSTLVILGAGGHGRVVADAAIKCEKYKKIVFLDDHAKSNYLNIPVVGPLADFSKWVTEAEFFVAFGDSHLRQQYLEQIRDAGGEIATIIHPQACIGSAVEIGAGTVVMAGAVINVGTTIGQGVIVNTSSSVDHDCTIEDYCHVAVGAHLAGSVKVGSHTWIGAGVTVINDVKVINDCVVGAGSVVVKSLDARRLYWSADKKGN